MAVARLATPPSELRMVLYLPEWPFVEEVVLACRSEQVDTTGSMVGELTDTPCVPLHTALCTSLHISSIRRSGYVLAFCSSEWDGLRVPPCTCSTWRFCWRRLWAT